MPGGFDDPRAREAEWLAALATRSRDPVTARHLFRRAAELDLAVAQDTNAPRVQEHFVACARANLRRANHEPQAVEQDLREQAMERAS